MAPACRQTLPPTLLLDLDDTILDDDIHANECWLELITNGEAAAQRLKIARFNLADYFQVIVIEGEFGCGKPDERVYRRALDALDAKPARTWMVGDSLINDVLAPQRLGLTGVWVNPAGRSLPSGAAERPAHIIRALAELV